MIRGYAKHEIVTVLLNAVQVFCTLKTGRIATKTEKRSLQRFSVAEIKFTSANRNRLLKQSHLFFMANNSNQKEILLVLNTCFFSRNWTKKYPDKKETNFSKAENLIEACWNGMTPQLLPEFFTSGDKSITLWKINSGHAFIDLEFYGEARNQVKEFSVNPYVFMQVQGYS